jgi:hypothetical protein
MRKRAEEAAHVEWGRRLTEQREKVEAEVAE